jgi:antitoxin VapB
MALSIKNEEAEQLARSLAQQNGESVTTAVTVALKERKERQERARNSEARLERIMKIVERTAPLMNDARTSKEWMDELYDDETGLPK